MGNFSYVPQRKSASQHPLFMFAKHLMRKNEIYYRKFWTRFEGRRDKIGDLEKFKRLVGKEMAKIPNLDESCEPAHFFL